MKIKAQLKNVAVILVLVMNVVGSTTALAKADSEYAQWISPTLQGLTIVSVVMTLVIAASLLLGKYIFMLAQRKHFTKRK